MTKTQLQKIIKKVLNQTNNCDFKKAFIPKGYAIVRIDEFTKYLTSKIMEKLK